MNWTASHIDTFSYRRVSWPDFIEHEEIKGISEASIEENLLSSIKVTGSLSYKRALGLGDDMVRIYATFRQGTETLTHCFATLIVSTTGDARDGVSRGGQANLFSVLKVLQDEQPCTTVSIDAGTDATAWLKSLLEARSLKVRVQTDKAITSSALKFEPDKSYLAIANGLARAAGLASLSVDAYGTVLIKAYQDPSSLSPVATLSDTGAGDVVFDKGITHELDTSNVVNKVVLATSTDGGAGLRAEAVNDSLSSPWSTKSRNKTITRYEQPDDIKTQEALDARAHLMLKQATTAVEKVTVKHFFSAFGVGDAVNIQCPYAAITGVWSAVDKKTKFVPGVMTETLFRRFVEI